MSNKNALCGIYCIENTINKKKYVGQAVDIKQRWRVHRYELGKNLHIGDHLQRAWLLYGKDSFEFKILELCSRELLTEREDFWIEYFDTLNQDVGYNGKKAGPHGIYTPESRKKMSMARMGKAPHNVGKKKEGSSSKYFGVFYKKGQGKDWALIIRINGKNTHIASFSDEFLAAQAYDRYVIEHNLDKPLNFPEDYN